MKPYQPTILCSLVVAAVVSCGVWHPVDAFTGSQAMKPTTKPAAIKVLAVSDPVDGIKAAHPTQDDGKRIVICGGGIGGLSTAFDARHLLRPQDEVIVISDREQFQFTPSNPWVALRKRTEKDISLPLAKILPRHNIDFVHAKVSSLKPRMNQVVLDNGTKIPYDYLVIATGPRLGYDEIPGARGHFNHTASICTTWHALHAADTFDKLVANPGPVVVGATQGASCFGPAYEYALLLQNELKKRGGRKLVAQCPIQFITSEPYIGHLGLQGAGQSQAILTGKCVRHLGGRSSLQ